MQKSIMIALIVCAGVADAQTKPKVQIPGTPEYADAAPGPKWQPLWPGAAPGAEGSGAEDVPAMRVYLPQNNPTRTAVVICPGGGYSRFSLDLEGTPIAEWFQSHGVAAFILRYRLGPKYHHPIQLHDAQRLMRMIRANAAMYGIARNKVGIIGFSAGGHLAASVGTHFDGGIADARDLIDRESSRPDFMILGYGVLTFQPDITNISTMHALLGDHPDAAQVAEMSNELHITQDTPPTFIYQTGEDKSVRVENSLVFYSALRKAGVPGELHVFQHGPHATGLAQKYPDLKEWPTLLLHWLQGNGWAGND